jgi:pimeloyl-ACP methyl ester carboxylesterase
MKPRFQLKKLIGGLNAPGSPGCLGSVSPTILAARLITATSPPGQWWILAVSNYISTAPALEADVILETLAGGVLSTEWIQPGVAKQVRVCSYDRAGYGWSKGDTQQESLERTAENLYALLKNANLSGPYIFVGHSIGGLYARKYAQLYPDQVAGIVLLDSSHPEQFDRYPELLAADRVFSKQVEAFPWLAWLGMFRFYFATGGEMDFGDLPTLQHDQLAAFWSSPRYWENRRDSLQVAAEIFKHAQSLGDLDDLPLAVVSAGKNTPAGWTELQDELAGLSTNSTHLTITDAQHASLAFHPDHASQVSTAILDLVESVRTNQRLNP